MTDFILKWAYANKILDEDKNYFSSYALTILIIFFLEIIGNPVAESIQNYCIIKGVPGKSYEFPNFQDIFKRKIEEGEEKRLKENNVRMTIIDASFENVNIEEMKNDQKYPKNHSSIGELIALFFYYYGFEYPVFFNFQ